MSALAPKVLVDTNVWVSFFEGDGKRAREARALFEELSLCGAAVYVSSSSLKDVFYLQQRDMKLSLRAEGRDIDKATAAAIRESAWSCVRSMTEWAIVVPEGLNEALRAMTYRDLHDDFEDDLLLAAAARVDADYVVTSDRALLRHAPLACLDPADMLALLRARAKAPCGAE